MIQRNLPVEGISYKTKLEHAVESFISTILFIMNGRGVHRWIYRVPGQTASDSSQLPEYVVHSGFIALNGFGYAFSSSLIDMYEDKILANHKLFLVAGYRVNTHQKLTKSTADVRCDHRTGCFTRYIIQVPVH
jgi:hypothetical protein